MQTSIEMLESRRLLSASVVETEPNNTPAKADAIVRDLDHNVEITGKITAGDRDWFKIHLRKGDILGAATTARGALDANLRLTNAAGDLLFALDDSSQSGSKVLPTESPLPRTRGTDLDAELWYVITVPGTYYIEVSGSESAETGAEVGKYDLDVRVARPGMESKPVGAHQILFLDFDGAKVDYSDFRSEPTLPQKAKLSPLSSFLGSWGMSRADGDAIIDGVVARTAQLLSQDIRAQGLNGDYDSTHRPGDFDLEIRNSRDDRDTWGKDPLVSRVVIGGTAQEAGFVGDLAFVNGIAETIDYGNFKTSDQAVASIGWITDGINFGLAAAPPFTLVDVIAQGIALLAAHEAGHFFGCSHTDQPDDDFFGGTPNVMDPGSAKSFIGPDFIFGSADDSDPRFGVDNYSAAEGLLGIEDTLNHLAFGLSTGKGTANKPVAAAFAGAAPPSSFASTGANRVGGAWEIVDFFAAETGSADRI